MHLIINIFISILIKTLVGVKLCWRHCSPNCCERYPSLALFNCLFLPLFNIIIFIDVSMKLDLLKGRRLMGGEKRTK